MLLKSDIEWMADSNALVDAEQAYWCKNQNSDTPHSLSEPVEQSVECTASEADGIMLESLIQVFHQMGAESPFRRISTPLMIWETSGTSLVPWKHHARSVASHTETWRTLGIYILKHRVRKREDEDLRHTFHILASRWRDETGMLSSPKQKAMHTDYQRIIGMGTDALPLIFRELRDYGGHWYWALGAITRHNPVPLEYSGNMVKMKQYWLEYATENGYL